MAIIKFGIAVQAARAEVVNERSEIKAREKVLESEQANLRTRVAEAQLRLDEIQQASRELNAGEEAHRRRRKELQELEQSVNGREAEVSALSKQLKDTFAAREVRSNLPIASSYRSGLY